MEQHPQKLEAQVLHACQNLTVLQIAVLMKALAYK